LLDLIRPVLLKTIEIIVNFRFFAEQPQTGQEKEFLAVFIKPCLGTRIEAFALPFSGKRPFMDGN